MGELIIEAGRAERQYWRDLWRYRELFAFMTWRDLLVRYKQTMVGLTWSLIRPFLTTVVTYHSFRKVWQDGYPMVENNGYGSNTNASDGYDPRVLATTLRQLSHV